MQKLFITNRKNQKIALVVEGEEKIGPLAFVMHGLGGFKEQPHIQAMVEVFLENGFIVVRFDTTNTFGESGGDYEDATTTNYYEDLEDVISWASKEPWYKEPFFLVGHSLGGICTALYAEEYPERVAGLAPLGTVVSGELSRSVYTKEQLAEWERTGLRITPSKSIPGLMKKLKWSHMVDRLNYNLLPNVKKLVMPILLIVGEKDESTPPSHQRILFDALLGPKELHIIKGAPHTFRETKHLEELRRLVDKWIKNYAI
ncbi:MAG: alpha/beta fold hydrolase [bacterium]|nr:alpha/beta fold hydrolase [bacterium]